ncbi:kinase-like domain-containing protein [Thelephora terrestris]|uniref:Kinase-like domain-containing protein n=1 Tax=Thelephora terrestris TaxID=56493 RepID=A0A9P6HA97_9AGAM|nr:kinase-like domain-containing protein [Thelephora terrestris]
MTIQLKKLQSPTPALTDRDNAVSEPSHVPLTKIASLPSSPTTWPSAQNMKAFGSTPLEEQIGVVRCKQCGRPVLQVRTAPAEHQFDCVTLRAAVAKKSGEGVEGPKTGKKGRAEDEIEDPTQPKKNMQAATKVTKSRLKGPVDYDEQCGVISDKRSVQDRPKPYDEPLPEWNRANKPGFVEPVKKESKLAQQETRKKDKAEKKEATAAAAGVDPMKAATATRPKRGKGLTAVNPPVLDGENVDELDSFISAVQFAQTREKNGLRPLVHPAPGSPTLADSNAPAWKRLISDAFPPHEIVSVIKEIFASESEVKTVCHLLGDTAQTFINIIHEALGLQDFPPRLREKCLAVLCRICGRQGLLPTALQIPISYNRSDIPLYRGGFADVWKGKLQGRHVAVKVIRIYSTTNSAKVISRFCKEVITWNALRHPNVLSLIGVTMTKGEFAMTSEWMMNGNINEFVEAHWEVNRFELLGDVVRGLIYIHSQAMVHGDLKGANILVDQNGHARLADFGLLTIVSDPTYFTASTSAATGGTARWMSPELFHPERFGLDHSRPTIESDCYALGMLIYEVLSGQVPFPRCNNYVVIRKVLDGERPARPEGAKEVWFTNDLWRTLALCWETQARNRPSIGDVLEFLEQAAGTWKPLPPQVDKGAESDESDWDLSALRYVSLC